MEITLKTGRNIACNRITAGDVHDRSIESFFKTVGSEYYIVEREGRAFRVYAASDVATEIKPSEEEKHMRDLREIDGLRAKKRPEEEMLKLKEKDNAKKSGRGECGLRRGIGRRGPKG